jgi:hypothetical protein
MVNLEFTMIWMQRWTYTMILFILTRYLPIGYAYLVIHSASVPHPAAEVTQHQFSDHLLLGVGPSDCPMTYPAATCKLTLTPFC